MLKHREENGRRSTAAGYEGAEREREEGEWFRDKDEGEGEREEYKKHTGAGRARDPSLRIRRRVKRRETPEERRPRAAQEGERNTGFKEDNDLCLR